MRSVCLGVVVALTAACASAEKTPRSLSVSEADFPGAWPLAVPAGVIECHPREDVIVADGVAYLLHGLPVPHLSDINSIRLKEPNSSYSWASLWDLEKVGREFCEGKSVTLPRPAKPVPPVPTAQEQEESHQRALAIIRELDRIKAEEAVQDAAEAAATAADEAERAEAAAIAASKAAAEAVERAAAIRAANAN